MPVGQDSLARGRVAGDYQDAWFSFFNVNPAWRF